MLEKRTISILGCGWFGLALAKDLTDKGYLVRGSCTREEKLAVISEYVAEPYLLRIDEHGAPEQSPFFESDVLVICIPPNRKGGEASVYPSKIAGIKEAILAGKTRKVILISSTGIYPDHNLEVDERTDPQPDSESGKALLEAERIMLAGKNYELSIVRFGGLIGPGRDPARFFAGKSGIANGLAPVNLIHQKDCVGIVERIISLDAFGHVFNACSDEHPAKMDFYKSAAESSGLQIPYFIKELKQWKIVRSVRLKEILNYHTGKLNGV